MSVIASVIGGAVSAILGGVAYYLIDLHRTRASLKKALLIEIHRNQEILEELEDRVNPSSDWNGKISESFQTSAYDSIKINDPRLEANLGEQTNIAELYRDLEYLNSIRESTFIQDHEIPDNRRGDFSDIVDDIKAENEHLISELSTSWYYHLLNAPIH